MPLTKETKESWAKRLAACRATYDAKASVQLRIDPRELAQTLDDLPAGCEDLKQSLESATRPTHVLVWPEQLQLLLDHAARKKAPDSATHVPG